MENNNQKINILEILRIFLSYWPIIVASVIVFLVIGLLYLQFASKTYSVYARVKINTEEVRTNRASNDYVNVGDLMSQEKNFTNEITYIRSTPLIEEVIKEMNLFTSYYLKVDKIPGELPFSFYNIYNSAPFIVIVDENILQPINTMFYINIINENTFSIYAAESNVYTYNSIDETESKYPIYFYLNGTYKFGEEINNEYCSFKILLNSNYNSEQYRGKDIFFKFNSPRFLAYEFQEALSIRSAFYESSIADLSFEWENYDIANDFLTNLINKYIDKNLDKKNHNANNTIGYIDRQLSSISGTLGKSERQLQNFRTSQEVMNIDEKSTSIYAQRLNMESIRDEVLTREQNLSRLKEHFEKNKESTTFIAPSFMGMSDPTLTTLIQELTVLSTEMQNLINTNQLRNPRIKTLDTNITAIKKAISDNISFNLSSAINELEVIDEKISALDNEISTLPQTQSKLIGLEREFNINDAVYTSLLDKRIQAQIIKSSNVSDCEIIEPVRYLEIASPSLMKVLFIALFLGILFPSSYIIFVNFLTSKIRTSEELGRISKLKSVGTIPHNAKNEQNVIINYPLSPLTERFHAIRSNLIYYMMGEMNKCILITSTLQNEGKSFISLNLAHSFAASQYKTVLLSFDLRMKNEIMNDLKSKKDIGLSSYLINQASLDEIIVNTRFPNFDYISSGVIPPDPVALLSTKRVKELFIELKQIYDYIIIDTPPFGLVTDAFLLMQNVDVSLYISRLGKITKRALKQSMHDIRTKEIKNIYLVQNDVTKVEKSYYQDYYYESNKKKGLKRFLKKK